jgi:cell wall-associated NlpC family hydrolase
MSTNIYKFTVLSGTLIAVFLLFSVINAQTEIKEIKWDKYRDTLNIFTGGNIPPECSLSELDDEMTLLITITDTTFNLKEYPSKERSGYKIDLKTFKKDALIKIYSPLQFNYRLTTLQGNSGYSGISIQLKRDTDTPDYQKLKKITNEIPIYREPDNSSENTGYLKKSTKVDILEMVGGWYRVREKDGKLEGWVNMEYVHIDNDSEMSLRQEMVKYGRTFLGTTYIYGGDDENGFDCSGLVYRIYNDLGIEISRGSTSQYDGGRKITSEEAEPGDLVFFYIPEYDVLHVGLYTGGGKFINSNSYYKKVMEEELEDDYWEERFYGFASYL